MNDVVKRGSTALGGSMADYAKKLATGIQESRQQTVIAGGGKDLLRLLKSGEWVFGATNEEVQEGSSWIVNIMTLGHGWACWVEGVGNNKNELAGEMMSPMTDPKPMRPPPIGDTPYQEQRWFELKCMDGDDEGKEVLHKTGSVGGMRAVDGLLADIFKQLASNPDYAFPVIQLESDSYQHTKWGKIYVPILNIVGWANMDGEIYDEETPSKPRLATDGGAAVQPEPEPEPEPVKATGKAAKAPLKGAAPKGGKAPVTTAAAHTGQRRRPAR